MKFFLFLLSFFPYIRNDCLEFSNQKNNSINKCLIIETKKTPSDLNYYYDECLQCTIETFIQSDEIQYEEDNQCLSIELQCIQLIFPNIELFEDFFNNYQDYIYDLFYKDNGTDQNTLHIIIKENNLEEINFDYMENIFQIEFQTYRALFFELHIKNSNISINRDLINIKRLSMKLIFVCTDQMIRKQTIYIVHNRKMTLETKENPCSIDLISSNKKSTTVIPNEILSKKTDDDESKNILWIITMILSVAFVVSSLTGLMIYFYKRMKFPKPRLSEKGDTTTDISISHNETPLTPTLSLTSKRSARGIRAVQLLEDDV